MGLHYPESPSWHTSHRRGTAWTGFGGAEAPFCRDCDVFLGKTTAAERTLPIAGIFVGGVLFAGAFVVPSEVSGYFMSAGLALVFLFGMWIMKGSP